MPTKNKIFTKQQANIEAKKILDFALERNLLFTLMSKENCFRFISVEMADRFKIAFPKAEINIGNNGKRYAELIIHYEQR